MATNAAFWDSLEDLTRNDRCATDAVNEYTLDAMWRLWHIPFKYYLPGANPDDLNKMYEEIGKVGYMDLDKDGLPCCLSGQPSVIEERKKRR